MKKCLVTGSTGFVGSRLVKYLDTLNYDICLLSRKPNKSYKTFLCDFEKEQIPLSALEKVKSEGGEILYGGNIINKKGFYVEPATVKSETTKSISPVPS